MKKIFPYILVFILVLTLTSCKGTKSESVVIENLPETLWEGESASLLGKYLDSEDRYFYEWSTSDENIATIESTTDGVEVLYSEANLKTHKRGKVVITLKIYVGGKSSAPEYREYTLNVINETDLPEVENFGFDFSSLTLNIGESFTLKPTVSPEGSVFKETVSYSSEYPEIVSVDFTGKITALAKGNSVVSISYGDKSLDIDVSVISVANEISLSLNLGNGYKKAEETITVNKGDKIYYKVAFIPSDRDTKTTRFFAQNNEIISVTNEYIEAILDGESLFTVYSSEYPALKKSIKVIVIDPEKPLPPPTEEDDDSSSSAVFDGEASFGTLDEDDTSSKESEEKE